MIRMALCLSLLAASMVFPGCGGSGEPTVWVTGKLVKSGQHYEPPASQQLSITFVATEIQSADGKMVPSAEQYLATYDQATGTFQVPGRAGSGIPPGRYRVAITSKMIRDALNAAKPKQKPMDRERDYLDGKFGESNSPIVREIKASTDLTIDMDKPTEVATSG